VLARDGYQTIRHLGTSRKRVGVRAMGQWSIRDEINAKFQDILEI
jgi:hypothetical protein